MVKNLSTADYFFWWRDSVRSWKHYMHCQESILEALAALSKITNLLYSAFIFVIAELCSKKQWPHILSFVKDQCFFYPAGLQI
jgi:pimeloyl-CoA synthetase